MATCRECIHYELCADFRRNICETDQKRFEEYKINPDGLCDNFAPKSDYVKRERVGNHYLNHRKTTLSY